MVVVRMLADVHHLVAILHCACPQCTLFCESSPRPSVYRNDNVCLTLIKNYLFSVKWLCSCQCRSLNSTPPHHLPQLVAEADTHTVEMGRRGWL